ncbi:hypothetical protein WAI453_013148 [Rhynchosporium graminicola]
MVSLRIWFDKHNVAFLAWLDYTLEKGIEFDATIVDHLVRATGNTFSSSQVKDRMGRFVREERKNTNGRHASVSTLREKGSRCLHSLNEEHRKEVQLLAQQYAVEYGSGESIPDMPEKMLATQADRGQNTTMTMKRVDAVNFDVEHEDSDSVQAKPRTPARGKASHGSLDRTTMMGATSTTRISNLNTSTVSTFSANLMSLQAKVCRSNAENDSTRSQWHQEVEKLEIKNKRLKKNEIDLRAQITHLKIAQQDRQNAGMNPLEGLLFSKDEEIWHLKQQNHEMRSLAGFSQLAPDQPAVHLTDEIPNALQSIQSELYSILHGHDLAIPLLQPSFVQKDADLALLLQTLCSEDSELPIQHLLTTYLRFDGIVLVRSLAVAALQQWVFATDFPNFCRTEEPQILTSYRKAVFVYDGWDCLRKLELAAYTALLEDDTFTEGVVPRKAEQLASRLSKALAPLFARSADDEANASFETWGQPTNVCEDRRFRFKGLFEAALKLKAITTVTDNKYEFEVQPLGCLIAHDAEGNDHGSDQWFHASILVYAGEPAYPPDPMSDALVQTTNFMTDVPEDKRLRCLSKTYLTVQKSPETAIGEYRERMAPVISPPNSSGRRKTKKRSREAPQESTELPPSTGTQRQKRRRPARSETAKEARTRDEDEEDDEMINSTSKSEDHSNMLKIIRFEKLANATYDIISDDSGPSNHESDAESSRPRCEKCGNSFHSEKGLEKHLTRNTCSYCTICKIRFAGNSDLRRHRDSEHYARKKGAFKCERCGMLFSHNWNMTLHQKRKICGQTSLANDRPMSLASTPAQKDALKDPTGKEKLLTFGNKMNHSDEQITAEDYYDDDNDDQIPDIAAEDSTGGVKCPNCRVSFKTSGCVTNHLRKKVCRPCPECGKWAENKHAMTKHLSDEHKPSTFSINLHKGGNVSRPKSSARPKDSARLKNTEEIIPSAFRMDKALVTVEIPSSESQIIDSRGTRLDESKRLDTSNHISRTKSQEVVISHDNSDIPQVESRTACEFDYNVQQKMMISSMIVTPTPESHSSPTYAQMRHDLMRDTNSSNLSVREMTENEDSHSRRSSSHQLSRPQDIHVAPVPSDRSQTFKPDSLLTSHPSQESLVSGISLEISVAQVSRPANASPSPTAVLSPTQSSSPHNESEATIDGLIRVLESEAPPDSNTPAGTTGPDEDLQRRHRVLNEGVGQDMKFNSLVNEGGSLQHAIESNVACPLESDKRMPSGDQKMTDGDEVDMIPLVLNSHDQNAPSNLTGLLVGPLSQPVQSSRFRQLFGNILGGSKAREDME